LPRTDRNERPSLRPARHFYAQQTALFNVHVDVEIAATAFVKREKLGIGGLRGKIGGLRTEIGVLGARRRAGRK
jgi:hypothetical protein